MDEKKYQRILAISDIHGQKKHFLKVLEQSEYDPSQDLLIIAGDSLDRGEDNMGSFELCQNLHKNGAVFLKGNHEQMLEENLQKMLADTNWKKRPPEELMLWFTYNGGAKTLNEIKNFSITKLTQLFFYIRAMPTHFVIDDYIFAHAGINPAKELSENTSKDFVWGLRDFYAHPAYIGKTVIFGHTPTFYLPDAPKRISASLIWHDPIHHDKIDIDCGCVFGGRLACLELPSLQEYYCS